MHEFSLANSIVRIVQDEMVRYGATAVIDVRLRVGRLRQIVPSLLVSAFDATTRGTPMENARLTIEESGVRILCRDCGGKAELDELLLVCPRCGAGDLNVTSGDEILVTNIEMEVRDERPCDAQRV